MASPKPAPKNYYAILGVDPSCSVGEIKKAYHVLAHRYHPDRAAAGEAGVNSQERMVAINEAFAVLSNAGRRAKLDRELAAAAAPPPGAEAAEEWEFPTPTGRDLSTSQPIPSNAALDKSVAQEFLDQIKVQILSEAMAVRLKEEHLPGWVWLLQGRNWRLNYAIGALLIPALNPQTVREGLAQAQALIAKLRSAWRTNFFVFLLAFQSLNDRDTVLKLLRTYCNHGDTSIPKNQVNLVAVDLKRHQFVLCGKRTGDAQHRAIMRALGLG